MEAVQWSAKQQLKSCPETVTSKEVPGERAAETGKSGLMSGTHLLGLSFRLFFSSLSSSYIN